MELATESSSRAGAKSRTLLTVIRFASRLFSRVSSTVSCLLFGEHL